MQRWTCPHCGYIRDEESFRLPIGCICGNTDSDGSTIIDAGEGFFTEAQHQMTRAVKQVQRYSKSTKRWIAAGRPVRTSEEVDSIFRDHCSTCVPWFRDGTCQHPTCGCNVRSAQGENIKLFGIDVSLGFANNKLRRKTEYCPVGKWGDTVDVLIALQIGNPAWNLDAPFQAMGLTSHTLDLHGDKLRNANQATVERKPKVVINRSFCIPHVDVAKLANKFPDTQWVTVNHSSQAHLVSRKEWLSDQIAFIKLAQERSNCWYAMPDERNYLSSLGERIVWMPNYVDLPEPPITPRRIHDPVIVSLVGRRDLVKNFPTQIIAASVANKITPLRLLIITVGEANDFAEMARMVGVECELVQWSKQSDYLQLITDRVDVALQASLTESFNYVSVDHLSHGIPVVGSPVIRYLPSEWQAQPDDANSIAAVLIDHIKQWRVRSLVAGEIAKDVARRNEDALKGLMLKLCGKSK